MKWRDCLIGDFISKGSAEVQTGPFGTQLKASDYVSDGTPVINVRNVGYADLRAEKLEYVADHTADRLRVHLLKENDIVFGRKGAVDRHLFVAKDQENWMQGSDCIRLRFSGTEVYPRFVSYAFLQKGHQQWMLTQSGNKATMASLNQDIIGRIPLRLPLRTVQVAIVNVLSAYDEQIKNNRRRMGLLEKAAQLLYEEWFVRLRFPGHEQIVITDGVPQGWERGVLANAAQSLEDGDWIESKDQGGEDFRLLQISNIGMNEFVETGNFRFISEEVFRRLNCRELDPCDLLISRMPQPIGRAWLVTPMPWKMVTAVDAAILKPNVQVADPYFLLYHLNSAASIGYCEQHAGGATRPRITRRELAKQPLILPTLAVQSHFRDVVKPMNDLRYNLYRSNVALRAARDLLLPRLMSGEIEV